MKKLIAQDKTWSGIARKYGYKVESLPVEQLTPCAIYEDERWKPIVEGIEPNGLQDPLLIYKMPAERWQKHKKYYGRSSAPLPDNPYVEDGHINVVWVGRQRLQAIGQTDITHVDCVRFDDLALLISEYQGLKK